MRESEGIYHFGTKRVFVKVENGKIISMSRHIPYLVRVGGGFLNLEEFLEMYGDSELDKIHKWRTAKGQAPT